MATTVLVQNSIAFARNKSRVPPTTTAIQSTSLDESPVSEDEAQCYYYGLPSRPRLVARSSTPTIPWTNPTDPEGYNQCKELRSVGNHALNDIWEDTLASLVLDLLNSEGVKWTSVDVVRIGIVGEPSAPVILWIGVIPMSLSPVDGLEVALKCKRLLEKNVIIDVHAEFRESIIIPLVGPRFLDYPPSSDPTVEVRRPLTATLGFSICAQSTPSAEGTGGFYMAEGGGSKRILLITARHVVFPPKIIDNDEYEYKNPDQPRENVLLLSDSAFRRLLDSMESKVRRADMRVESQEARLKLFQEMEDGKGVVREREEAQAALARAKEAIEGHKTYYRDVLKNWGPAENRVLGYVLFAPSIEVTPEGHTEDFAIIALEPSKIDTRNFKGNVIDLGTQITPEDFSIMMHPHPTNPTSFKYPPDRLLKLQDTISMAEMRRPTTLDQNGEPCLTVIKRGEATGLTIGRANNILSRVRCYFGGKDPQESKEWAIFPQDSKPNQFSAQGDSGAVVVDGRGRIGGLITGGSGLGGFSDITYATPIDFLMQRITDKFPNAHLNPVLTT